MIFYFSATGNSRHAARRLLPDTGGALCPMTASGAAVSPAPEEAVGLVFPTYFWGLPTVVESFLRRLTVPAGVYVYCVATCGVMSGAAGAAAARELRKNGISLSARFSVTMPDTWTPIFNLSDREKTAAKNRAAEAQLNAAARRIRLRQQGDFMRGKAPLWLTDAFVRPAYESARRTAHFAVSEACVGCGACAQDCPAAAIELRGGRPVRVKDRCILCLGCLHRCPRFAISYGKRTSRHGQYQHPGEMR